MRRLISIFKQLLTTALDVIVPSETLAASKAKWNRLAAENARYYVLTNQGPAIEEREFRAAGEADVVQYIDNDSLLRTELWPFKAKRVLEIGCGIGRLSEFIAERFATAVGIDISEKMIERATQRLNKDNLSFFATDGTTYPFEDNSFDFVFSFITFQHMPDRETVRRNMEEVARVLSSRGLAKIQLRGVPVKKTRWFYGPSFDRASVEDTIAGLPFALLKTEGEGEKYFWITLRRT